MAPLTFLMPPETIFMSHLIMHIAINADNTHKAGQIHLFMGASSQ
jgi:hypothetical protein